MYREDGRGLSNAEVTFVCDDGNDGFKCWSVESCRFVGFDDLNNFSDFPLDLA